MERTNRPTQVGRRNSADRQAQMHTVMQPGGRAQESVWANHLAREYDKKTAGQESERDGNGQQGGQSFRNFRSSQPYKEQERQRETRRSAGGYGRLQAGAAYKGAEYVRDEPLSPGDMRRQGSQRARENARNQGSESVYERQQPVKDQRTAKNEYTGQGNQSAAYENRRVPGVREPDRYPAGRQGEDTVYQEQEIRREPASGRNAGGQSGDIFYNKRQSGQESGRSDRGERRQVSAPRETARRQGESADQSRKDSVKESVRRQPGQQTAAGNLRSAKMEGRNNAGRPGRAYGNAGERQETDRENRALSKKDRGKPGRKLGRRNNFLVQGSILAAAGIVVRLIGMVYRIPLARKIGDVGNGYYNAAYSIYSILLIMSSYSLPTAVSKMVSARLAKGQYRTSTKIFRAAMFYATAAGMAGFCALWFGADYFANSIIKMPYSSYALKALAPTIWIMAYLGVLRGYFQGHSTMIPTAVSQVFEQVVNAVISIVAASVLFDMGVKSNLVFHDTQYSYAFGAAGGAIGTGAGAVTALIMFLFLTMAYVPTMRKQARRDRGYRVESYGAISRALFVTIVPIIISSAIYNVSNVVDNSIFGHVMEGLGESSQTASQWGVYMGRYHMLFNIPVAIANSLSSSLIPSLSRAMAEKNRKQVLSKIGSAIRFSMIIAVPSAVGLTVLAEPVSNLLFSGMDNEMLIQMMLVGSSAVVFFSLSTVSNAILQGINRMQVPIINSAVSLAVHVGALYVMLQVFHFGIYSVVYANILFAVLVCILNAISIARYTRYRQEIVKTFLIPCGASAAMGGAAWEIYRLCAKVAGNMVSTGVAILAAVVVYFVLLILLKGVNEQELRTMPGGTKILKAARKMHLM